MPEMTPLRNNPPQSLAQPMRQAYDYWQEVPWHKRKKPKNASLFAAKVINNARKDLQACAWRVPPPSRGSSPLLPVCKSYQQRKKRPSRGVYPPPRGAGSRYYPYAKVINSARDPLPGPLQRF